MGHDTSDISPTTGLPKGYEHTMKGTESDPSIHLENASSTTPPESLTSNDPKDPRNWPKWKKNTQILMVAFHSMSGTFMSAGIIPAYEIMADKYGVSVTAASYLTSMQILLLGITPLFWKPIAAIYGRYRVFMYTILGCMFCNIGGALCKTYGAQMATRVIVSFLVAGPMGIGSGVITDLCEPGERAQKIGWWTMMLTLGTPGGPFIMGFVTQHLGLDWIFWLYVIMNFGQFLFYVFLGDESIYIPANNDHSKDSVSSTSFFSKLIPRRVDPRPLTLREFFEPLFLVRYPKILIPAIAHCVVFCYGNIALIVEMPISSAKFNFNPQQIGLQFIAIIIGCALGEQFSGPLSDKFLRVLDKKRGQHIPADRLWISYIGFITVITGLLVWGFQLQKAEKWNVTPCIGAAIASFGNQIITTTLVSFAVDSHRDQATSVGVCVNVFRNVYGFCGPFYFPYMFDNLNFGGAAGVMCALIGGVSLLPIIATQFVATRSRH